MRRVPEQEKDTDGYTGKELKYTFTSYFIMTENQFSIKNLCRPFKIE